MGEYLRQEFNTTFNTDFVSGMQESDMEKRCNFTSFGLMHTLKLVYNGPSKAPSGLTLGGMMSMGNVPPHHTKDIKALGWPEQIYNEDLPEYEFGYKTDPTTMFEEEFQKSAFLQRDVPSISMNANARSLAKVAALMANKGSLNGQ